MMQGVYGVVDANATFSFGSDSGIAVTKRPEAYEPPQEDKVLRLKEIIRTYNRFGPKIRGFGVELGETTGDGFWTQTRWQDGIFFLEYAISHGFIPTRVAICDAGSGDGRMSTLFDVYGFDPIVNIELDERLVTVSRDVIDDLVRREILNGSTRTVHGDFTGTEAYEKAGVSFSNIPIFYMGINSVPLRKLADKIRRESPMGTKLIVYGMFNDGDEPTLPLKLEHRLRTPDFLADFLFYRK